MPLNKVKPNGNMYGWLDATWNTVKGKCPHDCEYCYMKKWGEQPELHFDEKELKIDLGKDNFIFVGSSCDLFADAIPEKWVVDTLSHCNKFDNKYLFQSKNPERIITMRHHLPDYDHVILGTTIESNRTFKGMCKAPTPIKRAKEIVRAQFFGYKTMITIEPIMQFDLEDMVAIIELCSPQFVNLGANTNSKVKLQEPRSEKIMALINRLKEFTEVKIKPNLKRLMK
jgi:DNA repair photolyase